MSVVCFSVAVHFVFFFFSAPPHPPPLTSHWSSLRVNEVHWTEPLRGKKGGGFCQLGCRAGFIFACHIIRPQVCGWGEQLQSQLSGPAHTLLWTIGRRRCAASLSPTSRSPGRSPLLVTCSWAAGTDLVLWAQAELEVRHHKGECHSM